MTLSQGEIAGAVFKPILKSDIGEYSLDGQMLKVLLVLDGKKDLATVALELGMKIGTVRDVVNRLLDLQVVEKFETADSLLDKDFFDFLKRHLSLALGPIAEVMIEDVLYELGLETDRVPKYRAAEIVDTLSRQIPREENRIVFQQSMINKIKEKGY